jgi:hypothetical protein
VVREEESGDMLLVIPDEEWSSMDDMKLAALWSRHSPEWFKQFAIVHTGVPLMRDTDQAGEERLKGTFMDREGIDKLWRQGRVDTDEFVREHIQP